MRNQTSFRLTTTLLPSDTTAKTTTVINKVDASGNKLYPTFTEETVVITNDDRTVMETTRATCNNGVLTFVKRGLSDDDSETPVENRKLTWNPGSLCFITAGAGDWIDKDDDIVWSGDQTYTGSATYKGELITEKGVKYPHFDNVAALEAYSGAFGGMFAVVDSTGELYRYNAVTEERALIESSQPANPEMADDETIGTVRIATAAEFAAGTDTGSQGEYLVATPSQIQSVTPENALHVTNINLTAEEKTTAGETASVSWAVPRAGFITVQYVDYITSNSVSEYDDTCCGVTFSGTAMGVIASREDIFHVTSSLVGYQPRHRILIAVQPGTFTATITIRSNLPSGETSYLKIFDFFYFG